MKDIGRLLAITLLGVFLVPSMASAATYYVDASIGNNINDGLSTTTPWLNMTKVTSSTFLPGDQILFNRGQVHTGTMQLTESGTNGNPIIIGAYGTGANPIIDAASTTSRTIDLRNGASYLTFQDLTVRGGTITQIWFFNGTFTGNTFQNLDLASTTGIFVNANATTTNTLYSNLNVHDTPAGMFDSDNKSLNDTFTGITSSGGWRIDQSAAATSTVHISDSTLGYVYARKLTASSFDNLTVGSIGVNIGMENTTFTDIVQTGVDGHGFDFDSGYFHNITITNATTTNNALDGINFGTVSGTVGRIDITNLYSAHNTGEGLNWTGRGTNAALTLDNSLFEMNGTSVTLSNGVSVTGVGFATTTDTIVRSNSNDGFNIKGSVHAVFDRTQAYENGYRGGTGGGSNGDGYSWHETSTGVLAHSVARDNYKGGIVNVDSTNVTAHDNVFIHSSSSPATGMANFHGTSVGNLYNNTFYNPTQEGRAIRYQVSASGTLHNNIIEGFDTGIIDESSAALTEDYNLIHGTASSSWSGLVQGTHSLTLDPRFVEASDEDFRLTGLSPAINAGTTTAYATDYLGNSQYGPARDIGAYEYQSDPDQEEVSEEQEESPRSSGRSGQRRSVPSPLADSVVNTSSPVPSALTDLILANRALFIAAQEKGIVLPAFILRTLGLPSVSAFTRDLTLTSEGDDVRQLQTFLIQKGYAIPAGATGYFGVQTHQRSRRTRQRIALRLQRGTLVPRLVQYSTDFFLRPASPSTRPEGS